MQASQQNKQTIMITLIAQYLTNPSTQLQNHIFKQAIQDTKYFNTIGKITKNHNISHDIKLGGIMMAIYVVKKSEILSSKNDDFRYQKYSISKILNRLQLIVNDSQIPIEYRQHLLRYYINFSWKCRHQTLEKLAIAVRYQFMSGSQQLAFLLSYYILQLQGPRSTGFMAFFQKNIEYILTNCLALLKKFFCLEQMQQMKLYKYWIEIPMNTIEIILQKYSFDVYEILPKYFKSECFLDMIEYFIGRIQNVITNGRIQKKEILEIHIKFNTILCKLFNKYKQYEGLESENIVVLVNKFKELGFKELSEIYENFKNKIYEFNNQLTNEYLQSSINLIYLLIKDKIISHEIIDVYWLLYSQHQLFMKQIVKYYDNPQQFTILLTDLSFYMESQTVLASINLLLNQTLEKSTSYSQFINQLLDRNQCGDVSDEIMLFACCVLVKGIMQCIQLEQKLEKYIIKKFKYLCYQKVGLSKQYFLLIWFYRTYNDDIFLDADSNQLHTTLLNNLYQLKYKPNTFSQIIFITLLKSIQQYFSFGFPFKQQQQKIAIVLCGIKSCINPHYTNLLAILIKQYHSEIDPQFLMEIFISYMKTSHECLSQLVRKTFGAFFECQDYIRFFKTLLMSIREISATYSDIRLEPSQLLIMLKPAVKALKTIPQNYDQLFSNIVGNDLKDPQAIYALNLFIIYSNQDTNFETMIINVFKACLHVLKNIAENYKLQAQQNIKVNLSNEPSNYENNFNKQILKQLHPESKSKYLQELHSTLLLHIIIYNHAKNIPTEDIIQLLRTIHKILLFKRQFIFDYLTGKTMIIFLMLLWKDFNRVNSLLEDSRNGMGLDKVLEIDLIRHMISRQNQYRLGYDSQLFVVGILYLLQHCLDKNQQLLVCADHAILAIILNLDRILQYKNNKSTSQNLLYINQNNKIRQFYELTQQTLKNFTFPKEFFQNNEFQLFHKYIEKLYQRRQSQQWFERVLARLPKEVVERMQKSKDVWKVQGKYRKIYKVLYK